MQECRPKGLIYDNIKINVSVRTQELKRINTWSFLPKVSALRIRLIASTALTGLLYDNIKINH